MRRRLVVVTALGIVALGAPLVAPAPATGSVARASVNGPITPDPAGPRDEPVVYRNGCHAGRTVTTARTCVYGDRHGSRTMVVFGDSHVAEWFGALSRAAKSEHVTLYWLTSRRAPLSTCRYGCGAATRATPSATPGEGRLLRLVRELSPDLV